MKKATPQTGAEGLLPHPYTIQLAGDINGLAYPPICPNCGEPASTHLVVRKPFVDTNPGSSRIGVASVPYCRSCADTHRRESDELTPVLRFLACFGAGVMVAAVGSGLFALFLAKEALEDIVRDPRRALFVLGVASVFAMISWGSYRAAYHRTEPFVIPAQSTVTTAFDFSDNLAALFEPERRIYAMRHAKFATAFIDLNRHKTWDTKGPEARQAKRRFWIAAVLVVVAAVVMWLLGWSS